MEDPPKKLISFRDKRFKLAQLYQYHLTISIGKRNLKLCCIDLVTKQCLLLAAYSVENGPINKCINTIEQLYRAHPLLAKGRWATVTLCIENQQYTLIPRQLFQEKNATDYLKLACPIGTDSVKHFVHPSFNVAVVFAVDALLLRWFQKTYIQASSYTIHQASSLIEGVSTYLKVAKVGIPGVFIWVEPAHLHITVMQQSNLLYYNRFMYSNSDEFLYYILTVMHSLKLEPSLHQVIMGGSIHKDALTYKKACHYIRKVTFNAPPPFLTFRYSLFNSFKKRIATTYFDVLSAHLCQKEYS